MKFYYLPDALFSSNARHASSGLMALAKWLTIEDLLK